MSIASMKCRGITMFAHFKSSTIAILTSTLLTGVGAAYAASPVSGFGPAVGGDQSLNSNLGRLSRTIARQNSPDGDVFQLALSVPAPEMPFESVAQETG